MYVIELFLKLRKQVHYRPTNNQPTLNLKSNFATVKKLTILCDNYKCKFALECNISGWCSLDSDKFQTRQKPQ